MIIAPHIQKQVTHLEEIFTVLRKRDVTFPKSISSKIVGSRGVLDKLISAGKIRVSQREDGKFGRFDCNAEDVIRYANYKETHQG